MNNFVPLTAAACVALLGLSPAMASSRSLPGIHASVTTDVSAAKRKHSRRHQTQRNLNQTPGKDFNEGSVIRNPGDNPGEVKRKTLRNRSGD
jgi:hypothetical protein